MQTKKVNSIARVSSSNSDLQWFTCEETFEEKKEKIETFFLDENKYSTKLLKIGKTKFNLADCTNFREDIYDYHYHKRRNSSYYEKENNSAILNQSRLEDISDGSSICASSDISEAELDLAQEKILAMS